MRHFSFSSALGLTCSSLTLISPACAGEAGSGSSFAKVQSTSYGSSKQTTAPTTTAKTPPASCQKNPSSFRFTAKHREANGIGYNQGYSSLDAFFLFHSTERWFPFFDIRAHLFNNGKPAGNFGFGIRYLPDSMHAVFGLNGFLDVKATTHSSFEQAGIGIEVLGTKWHMRANGYFPIFDKNHTYEIDFYKFQGHHALFRASHEIAFKGYDVSCGRLLLRTKLCDLSTTLGGYQFFADYDTSAKGGLIKFQSNLTPYFALEGQASYDSLFKGILQVQAAISFPFGKRIQLHNKKLSCAQGLALSRRIAEGVDRFEMIVSDHHHIDAVGKDPRTHDPLHIVFVDNTNSSGHGTAESPYNSLSQAQTNSSSYDMIYVYGGTGSPRNMDHGIVLKNGQWLQAASKPFILDTAFGQCGVPRQSSIRPSILNASGNTVTLSSNNIIVGFDLRSSNANIAGTGVQNVEIAFNRFLESSSFDISLTETFGTVTIKDNISNGTQGLSFNTTQNASILIDNNTFANSGINNANINFSGNSISNLVMTNNTFTSSQEGSLIVADTVAFVSMDIEDNRFSNIQSTALYSLRILTTAASSTEAWIEHNAFNSPAAGLNLDANLLGKATWVVLNNVGHYTGTASTLYPFIFTTVDIATGTLYLAGNFAAKNGYQLNNLGGSATFNAASLDGTSAGLENLNTGSFTINGPITYIPFTVPSSL